MLVNNLNFIQGSTNENLGQYNVIFGKENIIGENNENYGVGHTFCFGNSNNVKAPYNKKLYNSVVLGYDTTLDLSHNNFTENVEKCYVLLGSKASIKENENPDVRFAFGTKEKNGNVFTIDICGNTRIYGNLVVDGSRVILNTEVLDVSDNNIRLNIGGGVDSAIGGGITLVGPSML